MVPGAAARPNPTDRKDTTVRSWNTPDHHIADTEHGTLHFADGLRLVLADWKITEYAPDHDGLVTTEVRGWLANWNGAGTVYDPYTMPVARGSARLVTTELRGHRPVTDRDTHVSYSTVGKPYPNTWDHPGYLATVSWSTHHADPEHGTGTAARG